MTSRASDGDTALAVSALGTFNVTPARRRFMLFSTKARGLPRYSDTSIWSSETPWRWVRPAIFDSVSPLRPWYSPADDGPGVAAGSAPAELLGGGARRSDLAAVEGTL